MAFFSRSKPTRPGLLANSGGRANYASDKRFKLFVTPLVTQVTDPEGNKHQVFAVAEKIYSDAGELKSYYVQLRTKEQCEFLPNYRSHAAFLTSNQRLGYMVARLVHPGEMINFNNIHFVLVDELYNTSADGDKHHYLESKILTKSYKGVGKALAKEYAFRLSLEHDMEGHVVINSAWAGACAYLSYGFLPKNTQRSIESIKSSMEHAKAQGAFCCDDFGSLYFYLPPAEIEKRILEYPRVLSTTVCNFPELPSECKFAGYLTGQVNVGKNNKPVGLFVLAEKIKDYPANDQIMQWIKANTAASVAEVKNLLTQKIGPYNIQFPRVQVLLLSMLTQAMLSNPTTPEAETHRTTIVTEILETCYAAGYNILAELSLASNDNHTVFTNDFTKILSIPFYSFLELAYVQDLPQVVQIFYEFGHEPLSKSQLNDFFRSHQSLLWSELARLAIYYQVNFPQDLQELMVEQLISINHANSAADLNTPLIYAEKFRTLEMVTLYGSCFKHGYFGGTARIKITFARCFGKEDEASSSYINAKTGVGHEDKLHTHLLADGEVKLLGITILEDQSLAQLHPRVMAFKRLFKGYANQEKTALRSVAMLRTLRDEGITVAAGLARHIVNHPVNLTAPKQVATGGQDNSAEDAKKQQTDQQQQQRVVLRIAKAKLTAARMIGQGLYNCQDGQWDAIPAMTIENTNHNISSGNNNLISTADCEIWDHQSITPYQALNTQRKPDSSSGKNQRSRSKDSERQSTVSQPKTATAKMLCKWMPLPQPAVNSEFAACRTSSCTVSSQPHVK